ncbi:replication initiator protein A [Deinococcus yavapaiensis]|uniref:replication initiator protein A n=1 Tax=Deinococcus yavapaiensis TaxID=309889 RepID=UPI001473702D|nr:replication initiator protein A [Deinococcus yavapaiensis]
MSGETKPKGKTLARASRSAPRLDEVNVGRLGLVSIHERIPADYTEWEVDLEIAGRAAKLRCEALPKYGVPHGLDNDITVALINLYVEAGAPETREFATTAYRVLQRAGLRHSGQYYAALAESLQRLKTTTYSASDSWFDQKRRWVTAQFNYIEALEYSSDDDELSLSQGSLLKIRLAEPITASIRAKYLKPLDETLLARLHGTQARALYRLLDARRRDPTDLTRVLDAFTTDLRVWAQECKISDLKPARIKRTLETPHRQLVEEHYLASVEYGGTRTRPTITYTFADPARQEASSPLGAVTSTAGTDASLVKALRKYGMTAPVARQLITKYGEHHVTERLRKFVMMLASGYQAKNPAGLLYDVIRAEEGQYADPPGFTAHARSTRVVDSSGSRSTSPEDNEVQAEQEQARLRALPIEARVDHVVRLLQMLLHRELSTSDFARLHAKLFDIDDQITFGQRAVGLVAQKRKADLLDELRAILEG